KKFVKGNLNNSLNQESVVNKNLTKRGIPELTKKYAHKWLTQTVWKRQMIKILFYVSFKH
ncbi:hypothetical protein, partial [Evansella tamaricis]|uniref:hypothetical protein n=1 Tax=Evansella tamaricis TaxID=2069301 RepID=UPI003641F8AB